MSDQPPWDAFRPQDPRQVHGQPQYPPQRPYGQQEPNQYQGQSPYQQQPYSQPPRQPSFAPGPQYAPPSGGPPYQGQPPSGQFPGQVPYGPPQGYGSGPRRQRKRRHLGRNLLLGAGGFVVIVIVAAVIGAAASGNHTVTTGQSGTGATPNSSPSKTPARAAAAARVGSTITLSGNDAGEKVAVTVVKVFSHAEAASDLDAPDPGKRLYAVQFRLYDTGTAAYSDSPSNGTVVVDSAGQSYESAIDNAAECQSFPGTENIASGSSGLGCVVYEVPATAKITEVQFTLDSGFGSQTGQWDVRS